MCSNLQEPLGICLECLVSAHTIIEFRSLLLVLVGDFKLGALGVMRIQNGQSFLLNTTWPNAWSESSPGLNTMVSPRLSTAMCLVTHNCCD